MTFTVIVTEAPPNRLRGWLSIWLLEVRAGVFLGNLSARLRERIWLESQRHIDDGNLVMAWQTNSEAGFKFKTAGVNRRVPADLDGFSLVRIINNDD
jgi:CRISPR-associated protein Cas2